MISGQPPVPEERDSPHRINASINQIKAVFSTGISAEEAYIHLKLAEFPSFAIAWRLFIDGNLQHLNDPFVFDKPRGDIDGEPGYLTGMTQAFLLMMYTVDLPLTVALIEELHDLACGCVSSAANDAINRLGYKNNIYNYSYIPLLKGNATPEGIKEASQKYKDIFAIQRYSVLYDFEFFANVEFQNFEELVAEDNTHTTLDENIYSVYRRRDIAASNTREFFITKLNFYLAHYNAAIEKIKKSEFPEIIKQATILQEIVAFSHVGSLMHPFYDGNTRTFVFLIANKLLFQNNFPFVILNSPNVFDLYSEKELCIEMIKGMESYLNFANSSNEIHRKLIEGLKRIFDYDVAIMKAAQDTSGFKNEMHKMRLIYEKAKLNKLDEIPIPTDGQKNSHDGFLLFLMAFFSNNKKIVKDMLNVGYSANMTRPDGVSLLALAILNGHKSLPKLLVQHNADIHKTYTMRTQELFRYIEEDRKENFIKLFSSLNKVSELSLLHLAVLSGNKLVIPLLLKNRIDKNLKINDLDAHALSVEFNYPEISALLTAKKTVEKPGFFNHKIRARASSVSNEISLINYARKLAAEHRRTSSS